MGGTKASRAVFQKTLQNKMHLTVKKALLAIKAIQSLWPWSTPILESMLRVNLSAIGRYE
jgi:hypothetical protein